MKTCGIYKIINRANNKYYVGSSNDITGHYGRWYEHKWKLNKGSHHNQYFQRAWNKYGKSAFNWIVVEEVSEDNLLLTEQKYLNIADTERNKCYNLTFDATAPMRNMSEKSKERMKKKLSNRFSGKGNPMYGKTHTKESREKISKHLMGLPAPNKGIPMTKEQKKLLSRKAKIRLSNPKNNPAYDHKKYCFMNLETKMKFVGRRYDFVERFNLNRSKISLVVNGKRYHHRGWIMV